jgi:hypothetical protein
VPLADEIDAAVVKVEFNLKLGVRDEKLGDRRREVQMTERHRGGNPEGAPKFAVEPARHLFRLDNVGKDISRPLVISVPRFGEAQAAGGTVKKAGAEPVFKRADPPADHRLGEPKPARGARETLSLYRLHEDRHVIKEAHRRSSFANNLLQK